MEAGDGGAHYIDGASTPYNLGRGARSGSNILFSISDPLEDFHPKESFRVMLKQNEVSVDVAFKQQCRVSTIVCTRTRARTGIYIMATHYPSAKRWITRKQL